MDDTTDSDTAASLEAAAVCFEEPDASSTVVVCAYGRRFVAVAVTGRQTMALCKVVRDEPTPSGRRRFVVETPLSDWIMMRGTVRDNGSLRLQMWCAP